MTIIYRETDPVSGRWTANSGGIDLSAFQIDQNFYEAISRIATLEANESFTVSISYITISGNTLTFHMTDHTLQGPFTIPPQSFVDRGAWAPFTIYSVNDTFNINGTLYLVIFAHTSAATFSAGANDGLGHNYYSAMLSLPGASLPTGGAVAQVLQKSTTVDFATTWGYKLPTGGNQFQVLMKNSSTNQDASWLTVSGVHVTFTPASGSALTSTDVTDAINELYSHIETQLGAFHPSFSGLTDVALLSPPPAQGALIYMNNVGHWTNTADPGGGAANGMIAQYNGSDWNLVQPSALSLSFTQMTDAPSIAQRVDSSFPNLGNTISGATTIDISPSLSYQATITGTCTLNAASASRPGQEVTIIFFQFTTTNNVVTFGTHFRSSGTLSMGVVANKTFVVRFICDGVTWWEVSRTVAL